MESKKETELGQTNYNFPIGSIIMFGGLTLPVGWRECNGDKVTVNEFPELNIIIAHNFGSSSTPGLKQGEFFLPDLRGQFIRGFCNNNTDPDKSVRTDMQDHSVKNAGIGSIQIDEFKKHTHSYYVTQGGNNDSPPIGGGSSWIVKKSYVGEKGGAETRPINAYLMFIIKVEN